MIFHTLCLVCVAAAYDDQSLMQQGVGIETNLLETATAEVWRTNLGIVQDAVKEIPFPGKMRQMAIDALMKSVTKHKAPSAEVQTLFGQIVTLLNTVRADLLKERNTAQTTIDEVIAAASKCNDDGVSDLATTLGTAVTKKQEHDDCRIGTGNDGEVGAADNRDAKCDTLMNKLWDEVARVDTTNFDNVDGPDACRERGGTPRSTVGFGGSVNMRLPSVSTDNEVDTVAGIYDGNIRKAAAPKAHVGQGVSTRWGDYFEENYVAWSGLNTEWTTKKDDCNTAATNFKTVAGKCDTAQGKFETDYCTYWDDATDLCDDRTKCYSEATKTYNEAIVTHASVSDFRVRVVLVIDRVICLIEELLKNDFNGLDLATVCVVSAADSANVSTYWNISERAAPADFEDELLCTDPNASKPGNDQFRIDHYSAFSSDALADTAACA